MELTKCPSCSAPLEYKKNARSTKCDFCGTHINLNHERKNGVGLVSDKKFDTLLNRAFKYEETGDIQKAKEEAENLVQTFIKRGGDVSNYLKIMNYLLKLDLKEWFAFFLSSKPNSYGYIYCNNYNVIAASAADHPFGKANNLIIPNFPKKLEEIFKYIEDVILCNKWKSADADSMELIEEKHFAFASMCYATFSEIFDSYVNKEAFWLKESISKSKIKDAENLSNIYFYSYFLIWFDSKLSFLTKFPDPETEEEKNWLVQTSIDLKVSIYLSCRREYAWLFYGDSNPKKWSENIKHYHPYKDSHPIEILNNRDYIQKNWIRNTDFYLDPTYRKTKDFQGVLRNWHMPWETMKGIYGSIIDSINMMEVNFPSEEELEKFKRLFDEEVEKRGRIEDEKNRIEDEKIRLEKKEYEEKLLKEKLKKEKQIRLEQERLAEEKRKREEELAAFKNRSKEKLKKYSNNLKNLIDFNSVRKNKKIKLIFSAVSITLISSILLTKFFRERTASIQDLKNNEIKQKVSKENLLKQNVYSKNLDKSEKESNKLKSTKVLEYISKEYPNGDLYEGNTKDGLRSGDGTYYWQSGQKYTGEWLLDKKHGNGVMTWPNGDKYSGQWLNDKKHGEGAYVWANGNKYNGEWEFDMRNGFGVNTWKSGDTYSGQWVKGTRTGKGEYRWANGDAYIGEYKNGVRDGEGIFKWKNGTIYEGNYKENRREGNGLLKYSNGDVYEGEFKGGNLDGYGKYIWADGRKYEGLWRAGEMVN